MAAFLAEARSREVLIPGSRTSRADVRFRLRHFCPHRRVEITLKLRATPAVNHERITTMSRTALLATALATATPAFASPGNPANSDYRYEWQFAAACPRGLKYA